MFYIILITGIIIDLVSKYFAQIYLQEKINIVGNIVYLQFVENSGIAFSIHVPIILLKIITISLIFVIFYYYLNTERKKKNKIIDFSFSLILAGAIGNGIERVFNSKVIDFIGVQYFSIFNIADSFITIGVILYIYSLYNNK